ncbi:MAG: transporter substrate-binding domain-containing protein [Alphaproteobacteria bacterium]|nr:transporter substrate-binding domain-containing protein [Alphaproteobacteria bacterium]
MKTHGVLAAAFAVIMILVLGSHARAAVHDVYVLNSSTAAPYVTEDRQGFLDLVVAEAFRRVGLKGEVAYYDASKRALLNANEDIDQGVAMRIKGLEATYPNLVRVPEPVISNDFVAYSLGTAVDTSSWAALAPYAVTYIHGWVVFERNLSPGQQSFPVKTAEQMFAMLKKGHVDVVLYERWQGLQVAKGQGLAIRVQDPPLASVEMFMYVHKNHADLTDRLAEALKAMKADGTYQSIFDRTLSPLAPE